MHPFANHDANQFLNEMLSDTADLNRRFSGIKDQLTADYPQMDLGWHNWWAFKLAILNYGGFDEEMCTLEFEGDPKNDPEKVYISLLSEHGS